ncbi:MAG: hypothetical protein ACQESZ_03705 [Bacteroidota bacterium]
MKGRFFSILLILSLILPVAATFLWLQHQKAIVKKEVKHRIIAGIDRAELELLTFHKKDTLDKLRWEHSKEFEYKGEMYDIVERRTVGDSVQYWCWWDYEETQLNKELDNLVNTAFNQNPQKQNKEKQLISFYKSLYNNSIEKWSIDTNIRYCYHPVLYQEHYESISISPQSPPPKLPASISGFLSCIIHKNT